jgi:ubiquinone/menaquinone biosynthesis C-methylase UbiE
LTPSDPTRCAIDPVVETYSELAHVYDDAGNIGSCWGRITQHSLERVTLRATHETVVDVGCGTGRELVQLALNHPPHVKFIGVEPAPKMRQLAAARSAPHPNVRIVDGRFERLPLETRSVDYLYSILAFHWTTDPHRSAAEVARVLRPTGEMDLTFIGRHNGREFITKTTPVFLKYMTLAMLVEAVSLRKQLRLEEATTLFHNAFDSPGLTVTESYHTFYDTLDGHWAWWVRIEGQFVNVPPDRKVECDQAVRAALSTLETANGIPYTVHLLHVRLRRS